MGEKLIKRAIQIKYPDGSYHDVVVYRADLTKDGRVVISYIDYSDGQSDSFTEIININGTWMKNPYHSEWDQYEFNDFDHVFSDNIVIALADRIEIANLAQIRGQNNDTLASSQEQKDSPTAAAKDILDPSKPQIIPITMVMFANEGEDMANLHKPVYASDIILINAYDFNICTAFFSQGGMIRNLTENEDRDVIKELFHSINLDKDDKERIFDYIRKNIAVNGRVEISSTPTFTVTTKPNKSYQIKLCSCANWRLFCKVKSSSQLNIDERSVSDVSFPNYLSSAMHFQLPLDMFINGYWDTNGVQKSLDPKPKL